MKVSKDYTKYTLGKIYIRHPLTYNKTTEVTKLLKITKLFNKHLMLQLDSHLLGERKNSYD